MDDLQDIVKDFLVETYENLDQLDQDLVLLEQDPSSQPILSRIFRTIHTIKGTCGFLGFAKLECVTHVGENLLGKLRDGELTLRPEITTALLSLVDAIREILANIETLRVEGEADYSELVHTLTQLHGGPLEEVFASRAADNAAPNGPATTDGREASDGSRRGAASNTVRVDVALLDKLMNSAGELVLARNQMLQSTGRGGDAALLGASRRLNVITSELQEGVMKTRMQPIASLWSRFPRLVRDLTVQCGKQVRLEMEGTDTELDKTILESIKDPLTHLARNAVDHGIESPEQRLAAGKPAEGCLRMRAFHDGGQVHIEISDDGNGLDFGRIRQKAVERGLVASDQSERMSERDLVQLIFAPGFSTADKVTSISGRGVGMDVVKTNVEQIGGTVEVQSQPRQGTTVKLKIPLTLAIIPALIIKCGGDRYAIPQVNLLELVRLEGRQTTGGIERLLSAPVYRLRGRLLPIVYLRRELAIDSVETETGVVNIVVLRTEDGQFGLIVDSINDIEEIVVKPLSRQLESLPVYAGATILGDGKVALILDVRGIAQQARIGPAARDHIPSDPAVRIPKVIRPLDGDAATHARQYCTFLLDGLLFGVEVQNVQEVIRYQEMTRVPLASSVVSGLINLRSQIVTAIDLRRRLSLPNRPADARPTNVVIRAEDGPLSLLVDAIGDVVEVSQETFEKPPGTLAPCAQSLVRGAHKLDDRLLIVLSVAEAVHVPLT